MSKKDDLEGKTIEELEIIKIGIDGVIRQKKRGEAKKEGKIVEKLEDLKCEWHPNAKFKEIERGIYHCSEEYCFESAYNCPNCGIVKGHPHQRPYNDMGLLCGSRGFDYFCGVCGIHIKRHAIVMS